MAIDQWMIRTSKNVLTGPYSRQQVIDKVLAGQLGLQDELGPANDYWFYLHETEEVVRRLGIQVPVPIAGENDRTNTETQTQTLVDQERTDPDVPVVTALPAGASLIYTVASPTELNLNKNNGGTALPNTPREASVWPKATSGGEKSTLQAFVWIWIGMALLLALAVYQLLRD